MHTNILVQAASGNGAALPQAVSDALFAELGPPLTAVEKAEQEAATAQEDLARLLGKTQVTVADMQAAEAQVATAQAKSVATQKEAERLRGERRKIDRMLAGYVNVAGIPLAPIDPPNPRLGRTPEGMRTKAQWNQLAFAALQHRQMSELIETQQAILGQLETIAILLAGAGNGQAADTDSGGKRRGR